MRVYGETARQNGRLKRKRKKERQNEGGGGVGVIEKVRHAKTAGMRIDRKHCSHRLHFTKLAPAPTGS